MKILLLATTGRATRAVWQNFNSETNMKSLLNITIPTSLRAATLVALALLTVTNLASAATGNDTWQGGSGAANFSSSGNWTSGSANKPPLSGDALFFGTAGANGSVLTDDQNGSTFAGITFNAGASAFTLVGNPFTLNGNITNNSTSLALINNNIALSANPTIALTGGGGNLTLGGSVNVGGGTKTITLVGSGTLTLAGANGPLAWTLGSGQQINVNNSAAVSGTGTITGGTIDNTGGAISTLIVSQSWNGDFTVGGTAPLTFGASPTYTMNASRTVTDNGILFVQGTIAGSGFSLTKAGSGYMQLTGGNSYTGGTFITNGVLAFTTEAATGNTQLGPTNTPVTISGGTLEYIPASGGTATLNTNRAISVGPSSGTGGGTFDVAQGSTLAYAGIIANNGSGTGSLTKTGVGTLKLYGANTYSGGTTISAGTLTLDFSQATAPANNILNGTTGGLALGGGGNLVLTNKTGSNGQTVQGLTLNEGGNKITLNPTNGASLTLTLGAITRNAGLLDFATNAYSGSSTVGTTAAINNGILGPWATYNGFNDWATVSGGNVANYNSYVTIIPAAGGNNPTVNYQITSGGISNLTSSLTASTFRFGNNGSGLALGANSLTCGGILAYAGNVSVNGSGYVGAGAGNEFIEIVKTGTLTNNAPLIGANDTGKLTVGGAGTVQINATNTYTGLTTVNGSTLVVAGSLASPVKINTGGTVTINTGGSISNAVEVGVSTANGTANFNNSGTLTGNLTIDAGDAPVTPNANTVGPTAYGYAALNAGSFTSAGGTITNNGILSVNGASALTVGNISSATGYGAVYLNNTANPTVTLVHGSLFSYVYPQKNSVTTLQVDNNGAVGINWFGYNTAGTNATCTLQNGTWNIGAIGQGNSAAQFVGTAILTSGATVNILNGGFAHGVWNVNNGTLNFYGSVSEGSQGAANNGLNLAVPASGSSTAALNVLGGSLTLGMQAANTAVETNTLTVGNGGSAIINGNLQLSGIIGNAAAETNAVNLAGGKLVVLGQILPGNGNATAVTNASNSAFPVTPTNQFNWTGGQLTAGIINISNGLWTAVFTNATPTWNGTTNPAVLGGANVAGGTFTQNAGTLAPGDVGYSGKTIITNGNYVLTAGGTLAIDLGGTTASTAFQDGTNSADYDNIAVTGTGSATLNGNLSVSLINGFTPVATNSFVILTNGGTLSGTFANLTAGRVTLANNTNASFQVLTTANQVILTNYTLNSLPASSITYGNPGPFTYTGSAQTPTISFTGSTGTKTTNYVGTTVSYNSSIPPAGAGSYYVSNTVAADASYAGATNKQSFTINPATPVATLAVNNSLVTYNGLAQAATVVTNSSSVPGTVQNVKYNGSAVVPTNAGTYTITADFVPNDTTDYSPLTAQSAGNFTINKATPVATLAANNSPVTYNGLAQAATVVTNSSSVPGTVQNVKYNGSAVVPTNAGTYTITADFVPNNATDYSPLTAQSAGSFTINKANLIITAQPQTITNGTAVPTTTVAYAGFVNGETNTVLTTQPTVNSAQSGVVAAGTYSGNYTVSGAAAANYAISYVSGTLTVNSATPVGGTILITSYNFTNGVPFTLVASGDKEQQYITQRSTNLTDWVNIVTNGADGNGVINVADDFSDLGGNVPSPLFYRLQLLSP